MERSLALAEETLQFLAREVQDLNRVRVFALLPELLDNAPGSCRCPGCVADVASFALSKLTPDYRWAPSTDTYPYKVTEETLRSTIRRAIQVVTANPRADHHMVTGDPA